MPSKIFWSPIILFALLVLLAPYLFWYSTIEHPTGQTVLGDGGRPTFEYNTVAVTVSTGLLLLMFLGGARGLYKRVEREGAVAPLEITLAAISGSFVLLGARLLSSSQSESVLARFNQRQSFGYAVLILICSVAAIVLLAVAMREQRRAKSAGASEVENPPVTR